MQLFQEAMAYDWSCHTSVSASIKIVSPSNMYHLRTASWFRPFEYLQLAKFRTSLRETQLAVSFSDTRVETFTAAGNQIETAVICARVHLEMQQSGS